MILIGQYDSPFVRRVAIALRRYGMAYEHEPWGVFSDGDEIAQYNPLRRVPTLVLDEGEALLESSAILEWLDEQVGPERALLPRSGPVRRDGLRVIGLATGLADKALSLFLETYLRKQPSELWMERCRTQIVDTLAALEGDRSRRSSGWWLGESLSHTDIAVACALCVTREAHPDLVSAGRWPRLTEHGARADALDEFRAVYQPYKPSIDQPK